MYCHQCGKEIEESKFCPCCGAIQEMQTSQMETGGYQQPQYEKQNDDQPNIGFALLSFFIPIVGLVLYLIWNKEYPRKAKSCLKGFITSIVFYVVLFCCLMSVVIGGLIGYESNNNDYYQYQDYDNDHYFDDSYFNTVIQTISINNEIVDK